jgi:tRNA(adenine34) deaminase
MCAGAIVLARLDAVIWGASDPKRGGGSVFRIFDHPGINHHPAIITGVMERESMSLLQGFFKARRS